MRLVIADQLIIVVLWTSIYLLGDYNLLKGVKMELKGFSEFLNEMSTVLETMMFYAR